MGETRNVRVRRNLTGMFDALRRFGGPRRRWTGNVGIDVNL